VRCEKEEPKRVAVNRKNEKDAKNQGKVVKDGGKSWR